MGGAADLRKAGELRPRCPTAAVNQAHVANTPAFSLWICLYLGALDHEIVCLPAAAVAALAKGAPQQAQHGRGGGQGFTFWAQHAQHAAAAAPVRTKESLRAPSTPSARTLAPGKPPSAL